MGDGAETLNIRKRQMKEKAGVTGKVAAEMAGGKEALSSRFTTDKDTGELTKDEISPAALQRKAIELGTQLRKLEAVKDQLVALKGEAEANKWERIRQTDVRP